MYADNPHNFKNFDVVTISGLSTTSSKIEGSYAVGIQSNRLAFAGVGTTGVAIGSYICNWYSYFLKSLETCLLSRLEKMTFW